MPPYSPYHSQVEVILKEYYLLLPFGEICLPPSKSCSGEQRLICRGDITSQITQLVYPMHTLTVTICVYVYMCIYVCSVICTTVWAKIKITVNSAAAVLGTAQTSPCQGDPCNLIGPANSRAGTRSNTAGTYKYCTKVREGGSEWYCTSNVW